MFQKGVQSDDKTLTFLKLPLILHMADMLTIPFWLNCIIISEGIEVG